MKAPAFQLYPQDFISSLDCQTMAPEEFGVYCWLLFHSWIQEPQCYLPNDPEKLSKLLRINPRTFAKMWRNSLEKKFKISNCGNYLYNERLIKELEKQDSYRKKQAQNGSKGGRPPIEKNPNETQKKAVGYSGLTQTEPKKSSSISSSTSSSFSTSTSDILLEKESKSEQVLEVENSESLTAETEKPKEKSSAKKEKVNLLFETPEFEQAFNQFLAYKKQIKSPIVETSYKPFFAKLSRLSRQNQDRAIAILEQTMANGWQGIFELKNEPPSPRLTITKSEPEPEKGTPEYYAKLKEKYTFSQSA